MTHHYTTHQQTKQQEEHLQALAGRVHRRREARGDVQQGGARGAGDQGREWIRTRSRGEGGRRAKDGSN